MNWIGVIIGVGSDYLINYELADCYEFYEIDVCGVIGWDNWVSFVDVWVTVDITCSNGD